MSNATTNQIIESIGKDGYSLHVVGGAAAIPEGVMVAQLAADGTLVNGSTALSGNVIGVSTHAAAIGATCQVETDRVYLFDNSGSSPCSAATLIGAAVFCEDNHTVAAASGGTLFTAGTFMGMDASGKVRVHITPSWPSAATVATEIDELQANAVSSNKFIDIPLGMNAILAAGTPMAAFADNASSNPGITVVDGKARALRWNNNASQTAVFTSFTMPDDIDITANCTLKILASKTGATVGDATKFTVALFNQVVGALHDADTDFGGDTSAMTGNATAKTCQEVTLTVALADLAAVGSAVTMSIKPKDGTLGTDDVCVFRARLYYKGKVLT